MIQTEVIDDLIVGDGQPLALIGGPCVIETEEFHRQDGQRDPQDLRQA